MILTVGDSGGSLEEATEATPPRDFPQKNRIIFIYVQGVFITEYYMKMFNF